MPDFLSVEKIKAGLAAGQSKEDIYKKMLTEGNSLRFIEDCFAELEQDHSVVEKDQQTTVRFMARFGVGLIAFGFLSFFAGNWSGMSEKFQLLFVLIFMVSLNGVAWWARVKYKRESIAKWSAVVGLVLFACSIKLAIGAFDLPLHWWQGWVLWMAGAVSLAFAEDSVQLHVAGLLVGVMGLFGGVMPVLDLYNGAELSRRPFISFVIFFLGFMVAIGAGNYFWKKMPATKSDVY